MNCSLYPKITDRLNINRTDQVCAYPRRAYRRQMRHNPYLLPIRIETKIENDTNNELIDSSEQKSNENLQGENFMETVGIIPDDQVVIPNEQTILNMNYQKKLKMKNHFIKPESEQK